MAPRDQPEFRVTNPVSTVSSVDDLDVNFSTVLKIAAGLNNAGALAQDLVDATSKVATLSDASELKLLVAFGTHQNLTTSQIPSPHPVALAAAACGQIGNVFLALLSELWGVKPEEAYRIMFDEFDGEPGYSWGEFLDDVSTAVATASLILAGVTTIAASGGTATPLVTASWISLLGSLGVNIGVEMYEFEHGNASRTELIGTILVSLSLTLAGGHALNLERLGVAGQALRPMDDLAKLLSTVSAETLAGIASGEIYTADIETLVMAIKEMNPNINPAEFDAKIREFAGLLADQKRIEEELAGLSIPVDPSLQRQVPNSFNGGTLDYFIDPVTGERVNISLSPQQGQWLDARMLDYQRLGIKEDFYSWLLGRDNKLPTFMSKSFIMDLQRGNMVAGPCLPPGS